MLRAGKTRLLIVLAMAAFAIPALGGPSPAGADTQCEPGTFPSGETCEPCPIGTFGDIAGTCAPCPVGSFQDREGATSCVLAPIGTYVDFNGAAAAIACGPGLTTLAIGSASPSDCVPDGVGQEPTTKNDCKRGGWQALTDNSGRSFRNQGDCVSYVSTGGRNKAAG